MQFTRALTVLGILCLAEVSSCEKSPTQPREQSQEIYDSRRVSELVAGNAPTTVPEALARVQAAFPEMFPSPDAGQSSDLAAPLTPSFDVDPGSFPLGKYPLGIYDYTMLYVHYQAGWVGPSMTSAPYLSINNYRSRSAWAWSPPSTQTAHWHVSARRNGALFCIYAYEVDRKIERTWGCGSRNRGYQQWVADIAAGLVSVFAASGISISSSTATVAAYILAPEIAVAAAAI